MQDALCQVYQNSIQCFITSSVIVLSSCLCFHTKDVPTQWVVPSIFQFLEHPPFSRQPKFMLELFPNYNLFKPFTFLAYLIYGIP